MRSLNLDELLPNPYSTDQSSTERKKINVLRSKQVKILKKLTNANRSIVAETKTNTQLYGFGKTSAPFLTESRQQFDVAQMSEIFQTKWKKGLK